MANITLLGASYTDVPAVDLPKTGGGTVRFYESNGGSLLWKSVTLEEDYTTNGVINFMNFLEIPSEDVLSGYVFFCEVLGNQIDTIYGTRFVIFKVFEGYDNEVNALSIKKSTFNSAIFGHASNVGFSISAGSVINVYKFIDN